MLVLLLCATARLGAVQHAEERSIPKYAHATAQKAITAGAAEASHRSGAEQSKLQQLVDTLKMDLEAARMRQAELNASVHAAMPTPPPPTQPPLLPNFAPESVPQMVMNMTEERLATQIPSYVHELTNLTADEAIADAAGLGTQVGEGIAMVAAPRAAEDAVSALLQVACKVASKPAEKAAYQAALAATNLTEAGEQAAAATSSIADLCAQELSQVAADLVLTATSKSRNASEAASSAASQAAAVRLVKPAAQHAAKDEMHRLFTQEQPNMLRYAAQLALAAYKAKVATGEKEAEVKVEADQLAQVMTAAEKMVDAAQHIAGEAGLRALFSDVDIHARLSDEVNRTAPDAFRTAVEDIVLP